MQYIVNGYVHAGRSFERRKPMGLCEGALRPGTTCRLFFMDGRGFYAIHDTFAARQLWAGSGDGGDDAADFSDIGILSGDGGGYGVSAKSPGV